MFTVTPQTKRVLSDTITPVTVYLRIRDEFPGSILLESADARLGDVSSSYICFDPVASFRVQDETIYQSFPGGELQESKINDRLDVERALEEYLSNFKLQTRGDSPDLINGLFGYVGYDAIRYLEDIEIDLGEPTEREQPDVFFQVFRYIVKIDHYKSEMYLTENRIEGVPSGRFNLEELSYLLQHRDYATYPFSCSGSERSNMNDDEFLTMVSRMKEHIARGDIFQVVPSRRYEQSYRGDDFQVYRSLRSVNPAPFLFYFDFSNFRIFGSSPEAQVVVQNGKASLYPIAGTCARTGDANIDAAAIREMKSDPKENAEHVMLVDLARNDLSKSCEDVHVAQYKEIQAFSHVIHITSQVTGTISESRSAVQLLKDTFPMGTLSGAPKHRAMQLIDDYEKGPRRNYGGAIGYLGFDGSCTLAIMIRTFLSQDNVLYLQAGAGIVDDSVPERELVEVKNKLGALHASLKAAEDLL
ncbi:MAG: anthranilate synthase component I family protein [Bdellovibrionales bacterium]|nr:anthranilate synthase component I family protein [Bdellovibrionales bacterium]